MRKRQHENRFSVADYGRMMGALRLLREVEAFGVKLTHERRDYSPLTPEQKRVKRQRWKANRRARLAYESAHPNPTGLTH